MSKIAIVTGGTSGIGRETVRGLAQQGFEVVVPARSTAKGQDLRLYLQEAVPGSRIHIMQCRLESLASIAQFAAAFMERFNRLDVLVCNAGLWETGRKLTDDGFEMTMGVNHLAHFYLTWLLRPLLKRGGVRVVVLSSGLHSSGKINMEDLMMAQGDYSGMSQYSNSKLANLLFAKELAEKLKPFGATANALHPGVVGTSLFQSMGNVATWAANLIGLSPEKGARTSIYVATSPELQGVTGKYFDKSAEARHSRHGDDESLRQRLWQESARLVGVAGQEF